VHVSSFIYLVIYPASWCYFTAAASDKNGILISACISIYLFTLLVADIVLVLQLEKMIFQSRLRGGECRGVLQVTWDSQ
jgi:hypothetical protein